MTIDNSDETVRASAGETAELNAPELSSTRASVSEDVDLSGLESPPPPPAQPASPPDTLPEVTTAHDSISPSRKLAPPPKPRRDSGPTSGPPSVKPPADAALESALSSSALKAPLAPTISYSAEGGAVETLSQPSESGPQELPSLPSLPTLQTASGVAPLSSPPPIPRRRSNPGFSAVEPSDVSAPATTRSPSDPVLSGGRAPSDPALKSVASPPRPVTAPPRPASNPPPPPAPARSPSEPPVSAPPPSSSAIFAMRIIAVGESHPPPPVVADHSADPTAYPASLGKRRSSRPAPDGSPPEPPTAIPPHDTAPDLEDLEAAPAEPAAAPESHTEAEAAVASEVAAPAPAPAPVLSPHTDEVTEELSDEDVSPDSGEKKTAPAADAEELAHEDAVSVPSEELAALQAQAQAKSDAKPPPPPKRAAGAPPPAAPPLEAVSSPQNPPPTPDPAAAKAAQRAKTRAPWWEDLFNEDFMRASAKVNEEQVRREVTFIEESLGVAAGGVVLDLGCGAGHHAVEFASRGYGVVGYDLSLYQLALAADVAQERSQKINFLQGDMREMAFEEMFDGVFCWNTTFGYFEEDKNLAVAQRVFKALRPGGMFLIDVINRDFAAASSPQQVWYEGDSCVCMDDMSVDYISSRLRVKRSIILDDGRTKEQMFSLRLYSLHELGKLLHEVGFRVTEASGHPTTPGVFFGPNSPRIIILAQRP